MKFKFIKLITPAKGSAFADHVIESRRFAEISHDNHILTERVIYSWLVYCARIGKPSSQREIGRSLCIHQKTVRNGLAGLGELVTKSCGAWIAVEPPPGLFSNRTENGEWFDRFSYNKLFLPNPNANIEHENTSRRFGLNHACVYAMLAGFAKKTKQTSQTPSSIGRLLSGLHRDTVTTIINDLLQAKLISQVQKNGRTITSLNKLTPETARFFQIDSKPKQVSATEPRLKPLARLDKYELTGTAADAWLLVCEGHMTQRQAEEAIRRAVELGCSLDDFKDRFSLAKAQHVKNQTAGKIGKGNIGNYFISRLETALGPIREERRTAAALAERVEYLNSPEYKALLVQAVGDPTHPEHRYTTQSITDRVKFSDNPQMNQLEAEHVDGQLRRHIGIAIGFNLPAQVTVDITNGATHSVMKHSLAQLNDHFGGETFATPDELIGEMQRQCDESSVSVDGKTVSLAGFNPELLRQMAASKR